VPLVAGDLAQRGPGALEVLAFDVVVGGFSERAEFELEIR